LAAARSALALHSTQKQVDVHRVVDRKLSAAPAAAEHAVVSAIDREVCLKSHETANVRHFLYAKNLHGNRDAMRDAVNRQVAGHVESVRCFRHRARALE